MEVTAVVEIYGTHSCPYTTELREHLIWTGIPFTEFDVDDDAEARARMLGLTHGNRTVPVLIRNGTVAGIGWHGRGCVIAPDAPPT